MLQSVFSRGTTVPLYHSTKTLHIISFNISYAIVKISLGEILGVLRIFDADIEGFWAY